MSTLRTHVSERRQAAGLTVTALAELVRISRQSLTAIEAGRSTPSTAVALALARVLACRVEDLFALPDPQVPDLRVDAAAGTRVALGRVADRWVAHPLGAMDTGPADGLVSADGAVDVLGDLDRLDQTVLVAGCAPVLGALAGRLDRGDVGARWLQHTSSASLQALADGRAHLAGLHLAHLDDPDAHDQIVRERFPGVPVDIIGLVAWREGIAVAPGNPLGISGVADLLRVRVARRPAGSGAARVLSEALAAAGCPDEVAGPEVATHQDAAAAIRHGAADAAVIVEPVADAFGLTFLPLVEERFELVVRADQQAHPGVRRLLDTLADRRFASEVRAMGAYDLGPLGQLRRVA